MRSLIGSILGCSETETVGIAGPSQCDLAVADQAAFIMCAQSIDEVVLTINGARSYLWRAVDQDDNVLNILVQSRRNKKAAKKFFKKLLKLPYDSISLNKLTMPSMESSSVQY